MAVEEINGDPRILPNHVLHLTVQNYSIASFGSQLAAFGLLENHPVAVIGPHTSDQAARFSPIAAATQVPFISASATDVQLTQGATRPFFMRTVASDGVQMAAMAGGDEACQIPGGDEACQMPELIKHYKWQQVALIYSDDRFGRNGVAALTSQLITIRAEADVAVRVAIPRSATDEAIHDYISSLVPLDVAVYVLHASATVFSTVVEAASVSFFAPLFPSHLYSRLYPLAFLLLPLLTAARIPQLHDIITPLILSLSPLLPVLVPYSTRSIPSLAALALADPTPGPLLVLPHSVLSLSLLLCCPRDFWCPHTFSLASPVLLAPPLPSSFR
ncbi:unnamed protein product [Closterium sp. NIES-65]|nr:unnamed protein product [Closterium sp. NIES-65]